MFLLTAKENSARCLILVKRQNAITRCAEYNYTCSSDGIL